ncbi:DUF2125 domain-containing protein [Aestuariivirga sp.]|uniref:DUF2125 domain-containing protein n=1 Tax=Aestuariivirga sp. TaxID=2650926 RepID=UPI00391B51D9
MPDKAPKPWKMMLPLAIVLGLAVLWASYWLVASRFVEQKFAAERARLAAQGLTLTCTEEAWGGFPFRFEFICSSPVLTATVRAEARSGRLHLVALAYAPWQIAALVDGPTTVAAAGLAPTVAEHQRALAAFTFGSDGKASFSAEVPALSVSGHGRAGRVMAHGRPASRGTDVALSLSDIVWEPQGRPPLKIAQAELLGTLTAESALRIDRVELKQGNLRYWGSGMLRLDESRRLAGMLETETNDLDGLLALVAPHLQIDGGDSANLRTMMTLLGESARLPIIAKDGALYIGPFKIADLAPLY